MSRKLKKIADYIAVDVQYVRAPDPKRKEAAVYADRDTVEVPLSDTFD